MATLIDFSQVVTEELVNEQPLPVNKLPATDTNRDSGSWSIEEILEEIGTDDDEVDNIIILELPGADLTQEELIETFASKTIPTPPPPPPLPSSSHTHNGTMYLYLFRHHLPGAYISDKEFTKTFTSNNLVSTEKEHEIIPTEELCPICYEKRGCSLFTCCNYMVCKTCVETIIKVNINEGRTYIPCLNPDCTKPMTRDFINKQLGSDRILKDKYERFRINHEEDSSKKTCPNCCMITERDDLPPYKLKQVTPQEYNIQCSGCSFHWCFNCHSPWHEGISCELYRQGDQQFQKWTKHRNNGFVPNCQKCPKCKVFIERSSGCDYMTCNRCNSNFCYKCGGHFTSYPLLGDHYKKLGVLGCSYNYKPDQPTQRRLTRGGYLFVKAAAATGYPVLLVGGCIAVVIGAGVVLPVIGSIALYRYIRRRRRGW